ncbi:unnamed protein product [Closterium sp. NIES-53]
MTSRLMSMCPCTPATPTVVSRFPPPPSHFLIPTPPHGPAPPILSPHPSLAPSVLPRQVATDSRSDDAGGASLGGAGTGGAGAGGTRAMGAGVGSVDSGGAYVKGVGSGGIGVGGAGSGGAAAAAIAPVAPVT